MHIVKIAISIQYCYIGENINCSNVIISFLYIVIYPFYNLCLIYPFCMFYYMYNRNNISYYYNLSERYS